MRTKNILGQDFVFFKEDEIKWGAKRRVQRFLVSRVLPMMKGASTEEEVYDSMLNNSDRFAEYIQLEEDKEETNDLLAVMLVTNQSYEQLEDLSIPIMEELIKEVKKEVNSVPDFLVRLKINTQSSLEKIKKAKKKTE